MKPLNRPVIERRGAGAPRQPFKAKAWSHQDDLKAAIGQRIQFQLTNGSYRNGKLVAADQFTIKITDADESAMTYFKGNMLGYEFLGA